MTKAELLIEELRQLKDEIESKIDDFRNKVENSTELGFNPFMASLDAYVFDQLKEHIDNGNPYNQSLNSIVEDFEKAIN